MINQIKLKIIVVIGVVVCIIFIGSIGFSIGKNSVDHYYQKTMGAEVKRLATKKEKAKETNRLTQAKVNDFLMQYYTKTSLGENKARLKPLMTDSAYQAELQRIDNPESQIKRAYWKDAVFDQATIYIDEDSQKALCEVTYKRTEKDEESSEEKQEVYQETILLTYTRLKDNQQKKQLLVSDVTILPEGLSDWLQAKQ